MTDPTTQLIAVQSKSSLDRVLRRAATAPLAALLALGLAACGSTEERPPSASVQAASSASGAGAMLYDMPEMRQARARRELGEGYLEKAYATRDAERREGNFGLAQKDFVAAQDAYHEALAKAAPRFKTVIDNEIAQVMSYLRQIQRDRASPKVD